MPKQQNIKQRSAGWRLHDDPAYWDTFSGHALDAAVIDSNDSRGHKNDYISSLRNAAIVEALPVSGTDLVILDFGCGTGSLLEALTRAGLQPLGVDISMGLLKRCKERTITESPRVLQIDGANIPLADASVDVITVYIVLMYIDDGRLLSLLREMVRVLKPGGRVIVMEQFRRHVKFVNAQGKLHRDLESFLKVASGTQLQNQSTTICRYGHFPLIYLVRLGLIPRKLFGSLRKLERGLGRLLGVLPWDYVDIRIVLNKPAS